MQVTNIHEAKTHFSKLVERAAAGEEIIIGKAGKPVARLVQYTEPAKPSRRPGSMKGLIKIRPGFDDADREIEALFYGESIEPSTRHPRSPVVARRK
ncbi:MAG TPA: type II toxin-antitoxin system Phd/YefM family antitoxin [Bryobacteraceae bacterium]|jgi:prevent-host-death family protein